MHGPRPYKFIRFGDIHGPKPYKLMGFGDIHAIHRGRYGPRRFFEALLMCRTEAEGGRAASVSRTSRPPSKCRRKFEVQSAADGLGFSRLGFNDLTENRSF